MKWTITRKYRFYSAHRNKSAGAKCSRIHGHRYRLRVICEFESLNESVGMMFDEINRCVDPIVDRLDHRFILWDQDPLVPILREAGEEMVIVGFETSCEELARYIFEELECDLPIKRVEIEETDSSIVTFEK